LIGGALDCLRPGRRLLPLREDHGHGVALHQGHPFHDSHVFHSIGDFLEQLAAEIGVCHLAAAEAEGNLDLVALFDEALDALGLEVHIVLVGLGAEAHLFQQNDLLVLPRLAILLLLLVLEPAVVQEPADRRDRGRSYFDEVKPSISRELERLSRCHNAELLAILADDSDLTDPNPLIHSKISAYRLPPIEIRNARPVNRALN
jgi:hypothetical protein